MNDECLQAITKGDSKLMKMLLDVFISQNETDLDSLEKSLEDQDAKKSHYLVHKIKSSFKTFGFMACFNSLNEIETEFVNGSSLPELTGEILESVSNNRLKIKEVENYRKQNF